MTKSGRFASFALSLLLMGGISVTAGAAPASATITTLCKGYAGCAKVGMSDGGYSAVAKTMFWRMYAGHNCTNYAAYRMIRAGASSTRPWTGSGNATAWGTKMAHITNATPTVGSVAWWKAGVKPAGSAGHVAYVERVVSANEIIVSQDSWNGDFSWTRIVRSGTGWPSGFIHFRDVAGPAAPVAPAPILAATTPPAITGTAKVGSVLTASAGVWNQPGTTPHYQWMQDGAPISGATATTLTLTPAQLGKAITIRVTVVKAGFPNTPALSAPTAAVLPAGPAEPPALTLDSPPTVAGTARPGGTLTVLLPAVPAQSTVAVQWMRGSAPVPGATARTYQLTGADAGSRVLAQVTVNRAGYKPLSTQTSWSPVVRATPVIRVATAPGKRRLSVSATVTANGVGPVPGVVQVRSRGKLLATIRLSNGVGGATVTRLPRGNKLYRFRYVTTTKVAGGVLNRKIKIR